MKAYFGTPRSVPSVADAVSLYGGKEFESPTRSTIPMLSLLIHAPDLFKEIVQQIGFPAEYDLYLEYTVRPAKGRGKASHTDVMLRSADAALAIEGKWTEPMYDTVGKWLTSGRDPANRTAVLEGWLSLLQRRTSKELCSDDFQSTIYQMLHRAASAATAAQPNLAYFLFKPSPDPRAASTDDVFRKLADLRNQIGRPARFPFHVVEIQTKPLDAHESLGCLAKGDEATSEAVCVALQGAAPLFDFDSFRILPVE